MWPLRLAHMILHCNISLKLCQHITFIILQTNVQCAAVKYVSKITIYTIKLLINQLYNINKHILTQIPCKFAPVTAFDLFSACAQFYSYLMNQLPLFRFLIALVTQISSLLLCSTSFPIQYWVITLWFNTIQPKILTALINKEDTDRWNAVTDIMNTHYNKCFIITWVYLLQICYRHIHTLIPLACVECDDSLLFSGVSSIPLCYELFLPPFSTNNSSILHHFVLPSIS